MLLTLAGWSGALACEHSEDGTVPSQQFYKVIPGKKPTETEPGYSDEFRCPICDEVLIASYILPIQTKPAGENPTATPAPSTDPDDSGDDPEPSVSPSPASSTDPDDSGDDPQPSVSPSPAPSTDPDDLGDDPQPSVSPSPAPSADPDDSGDDPQPSVSPSAAPSGTSDTPAPSATPNVTPVPTINASATPVPTLPPAASGIVLPDDLTEEEYAALLDAIEDGFTYAPAQTMNIASTGSSQKTSSSKKSSAVATPTPVPVIIDSTAENQVDYSGPSTTRNLELWPVFSSQFPWRRLRMTPQAGIIIHPAGTPVSSDNQTIAGSTSAARDETLWPVFSSKFPWRRLRMTAQEGIVDQFAGTLLWSPSGNDTVSPLQQLMEQTGGA